MGCIAGDAVQAEIEKVQKRREEREAEKARMEEELVGVWDKKGSGCGDGWWGAVHQGGGPR